MIKKHIIVFKAERALLEAIGGDCDTAIGGLAKLSNNKISLKSELFSNDGKKKFEFQSSGHFKEAKEIGYKVGKELLKKAGSNFTTQGKLKMHIVITRPKEDSLYLIENLIKVRSYSDSSSSN